MDDRQVLDAQPLPIARGFRRWLNAREPRERHDAAYYLFEIYLKYLASIAIASYLDLAERDHRVNAALKGLARPSLGEWLRFLRECSRGASASDRARPVAKAIADLFFEKTARWGEVLGLYNEIRSFLQGKPSQREALSLEMLLSEVVSYRNRVLGHGAPRSGAFYERLGDLLGLAFKDVLDRSPFLTACRLLALDSVEIVEGSRIECAAVEYMGTSPVRRPQPLVSPYGGQAPRRGSLYLLGGEADLLCLDPLLVAHEEDVYFLNEAEGSPEYLSYATGARYGPADLGDSQRDLFRRILGYDVDEARVSRLGEDVAPPPAGEGAGVAIESGERRLGDFRIVREVGRGAMGVVFEAVQESLGRRVALKVLPGNFGFDPRRVERFTREARATARIHHPSIVPVYEVGEEDGNRYYAMEFIDGEPLDRRVARAREESALGKPARSAGSGDPSTIASAVEQMACLAEGLEEAHRLGLIHRDVKPSNILSDRSGRYVLVDFGLVREAEAETLTRSGEMMGTLAYMSPEQVSRRPVDQRTDVYGLGATLYEILTLRAPFEGRSDHEVQGAILFEEVVPPRKLSPRLHRDLETIILHALEKNPARRYQSAGGMAADLRRFLRYEPIQVRPETAARRLLRRAARHRARIAAAAAILILALVAAVFAWKANRPPRYVLSRQRPLTTDLDSLTTEPALSRDGKLVAYASDRARKGNLDIWVQPIEGGEVRQITSSEADEREPDFSPDGSLIAFRSDRGEGGIHVVPVGGGEERRITALGRRPRFSPDGRQIAYWVGSHELRGALFVVASSGGEPRRVCPEFISASGPVWLDHGNHLVFRGYRTASPAGLAVDNGLWLLSLRDGETSRMTDWSMAPGHWMGDRGIFLFTTENAFGNTGDLWVLRFRGPPWRPSDPPQQLTGTTALSVWPTTHGSSRMAFAVLTANTNLWSLPLDANLGRPSGKLERLTASTASIWNPCVTADGKKVCFVSAGLENLMIRVLDLETRRETTCLETGDIAPWGAISPSGRNVAYASREGDSRTIYMTSSEGGTPHKICESSIAVMGWSSDGTGILAHDNRGGSTPGIALVSIDSGENHVILSSPTLELYKPSCSADNRWIAFNAVVREQSRSRIFVAPFRGSEAVEPDEWPECGWQHPCVELCDDGIDNDGNGFVDGLDAACYTPPPDSPLPGAAPPAAWSAAILRGDADGSGRVNVLDAIVLIQIVVNGEAPRFRCAEALNTNGDDGVNVADALPILRWIFLDGPPLPAPFPACGTVFGRCESSPGCP